MYSPCTDESTNKKHCNCTIRSKNLQIGKKFMLETANVSHTTSWMIQNAFKIPRCTLSYISLSLWCLPSLKSSNTKTTRSIFPFSQIEHLKSLGSGHLDGDSRQLRLYYYVARTSFSTLELEAGTHYRYNTRLLTPNPYPFSEKLPSGHLKQYWTYIDWLWVYRENHPIIKNDGLA